MIAALQVIGALVAAYVLLALALVGMCYRTREIDPGLAALSAPQNLRERLGELGACMLAMPLLLYGVGYLGVDYVQRKLTRA